MIIFENKGVLDPRVITIMGVSSKDNPDSAIGQFGTGLKYSIAILLRNGCEINIRTGGINYEFGVRHSRIRNDDFDIVTMNDQELGFTTELGMNWEMWMAYRELHSNMLDEGGTVSEQLNLTDPDPESTYVTITGTDFANIYAQRDNYFLNRKKHQPLYEHPEVDLYKGEGNIFYKGVRVMKTRGHALFDYNHHCSLVLTEDRTIRDAWSTLYHVARLVVSSTDKSLIRKMVMCDPLSYESDLNFASSYDVGDTFLKTVGDLRKRYKDIGINPSAIALHKSKCGVTTVLPATSCQLNNVQTQQLDKAVSFCKNTLELELDDYRLIVAKDLGPDGNLGRADIAEGIMYISKQCFAEGTKRVATAILEEYTHCKHEVLDETVAQKWVYLNQIMSLGERIQGEPL